MKKLLTFITMSIIFLLILQKNITIKYNIIEACTLFIKTIFPSLFPIFVFNYIFINLDLVKYLNYIFYKFNKILFKIDRPSSTILIMSIISGCPSNAKIAKELYDSGEISINSIRKLILFTHFCNPLFILNFVNHKPFLVLIIHYISNVIIGIIVRNKYKDNNFISKERNNNNNNNFVNIFFMGIKSALSTLLFILGTIITCYVVIALFNIPVIGPILELSQGMNYINLLNINLKIKTILFGGILSFGGICIHMQVYGILSELKIKYFPYFFARVCQAIITMSLIYILY